MTDARNVLGEPLAECCIKPMTGFYLTGAATPDPRISGCIRCAPRSMPHSWRSRKRPGNDLSTPVPAFGFPGLKPGDCWCLCAERWKEAFDAGKAPKVRLTATHEATLEVVPLELIKRHAIDLS